MSSKKLNLQQKFCVEAKAAYERLVIQTLWETHPISFYHSASQEIVNLSKYFLRKYLKLTSLTDNALCLIWAVNEYKIDYQEMQNCVATNSTISWSCRTNANEKWNITLKFRHSLDPSAKGFLEALLNIFLDDIYKFKNNHFLSSTSQCFEVNVKATIRKLTTQIDQLFRQITDQEIASRIMLYYPAESSTANGFLFYADYDISDTIPGGDTLKKSSLFSVLKEYYLAKLPEGERKSIKLLGIFDEIEGYYNDEFVKKCSDFSQIPDDLSFNTYRSLLLEHPFEYINKKLRGESICCSKPICYQPRGAGLAGLVAKTGITYVSQCLKDEEPIQIVNIIEQNKSYALMHLIEQGVDLDPKSRGICTPLYGKGQLIGTLYATKKPDSEVITTHQIEVFESIAHMVGNRLQEIRDYDYFRNLVHTRDGNTENYSDKLVMAGKIAEEMKAKIRMVMNVYEVVTIRWETPKIVWESINPTPAPNKLVMTSANEYINIYLPITKKVDKQSVAIAGFQINMRHEDPMYIVDLHKDKLEVFFSYCWGISGYTTESTPSSDNDKRILTPAEG